MCGQDHKPRNFADTTRPSSQMSSPVVVKRGCTGFVQPFLTPPYRRDEGHRGRAGPTSHTPNSEPKRRTHHD